MPKTLLTVDEAIQARPGMASRGQSAGDPRTSRRGESRPRDHSAAFGQRLDSLWRDFLCSSRYPGNPLASPSIAISFSTAGSRSSVYRIDSE